MSIFRPLDQLQLRSASESIQSVSALIQTRFGSWKVRLVWTGPELPLVDFEVPIDSLKYKRNNV